MIIYLLAKISKKIKFYNFLYTDYKHIRLNYLKKTFKRAFFIIFTNNF